MQSNIAAWGVVSIDSLLGFLSSKKEKKKKHLIASSSSLTYHGLGQKKVKKKQSICHLIQQRKALLPKSPSKSTPTATAINTSIRSFP